MNERIDDRSWHNIQEVVEHVNRFQKDINGCLASTAAMAADASSIALSQALATADFQASINKAEHALRLTANLAFQDIQTQQASLQALLASSATNALQALQSSISMDWLNDYLMYLQPTLEHEPDEYEIIEYPTLDLLLPSTRGQIILSSPSLLLLEQLRASKLSLHDLHWRQFEEIVAELLSQAGYEVQIGPGSKDGGVDIVASKKDPLLGFFVSVWQAKKLKPGNKVDIHIVRELAYVLQNKQATKGIIVTTTSLTKDALQLIEREKYHLHKVDGNDLDRWIQTGRHP